MSLSFAPRSPYYPTTFLDRGVSVSFTTPALVGSRVRPGERISLELVVPNPSGGRGQYVLPWNALQSLCSPTLYDRRLQKAVAAMRGVTPAAIRKITQDVAAEGLAGREVKKSAATTALDDRERQTISNYYLLLALVQEVMPPEAHGSAKTGASVEATEKSANLAVAKVAPRLGLDSNGVATALEELAMAYAGLGLGPAADSARLPRTIARLAALRTELEQWAKEWGDDANGSIELIRSCTDLTIACAKTTLEEARDQAARPLGLLTHWCKDREAAIAKAARTEWITDGWDTMCAIWEAADSRVRRREAISEMAQLMPIIPKEAAEWVNKFDVEAEAVSLFRRLVDLNHDWRSGSNVFQEPAQAEHTLALNLSNGTLT